MSVQQSSGCSDLNQKYRTIQMTHSVKSERRIKGPEGGKEQALLTTKSSLRPSRISTANKLKFQNCLDRIQALTTRMEDSPVDCWEKEVSEVIREMADCHGGVLNSQKLVGYRQATILFTKMNQLLRKQAKQMNEQSCALTLSAYLDISQCLNNLTKDQRNDELVFESNLTMVIMPVLESFVSKLESGANSTKQSKVAMMRKHSLKKVVEGSPFRPKSRGKLCSLSKKQKGILDLKPVVLGAPKKETETLIAGRSLREEIIYNTCCTLKNLSANKRVRKELVKEEYLRLMNRYLAIWNDRNITEYGTSVLIQVTSALRHLVAEEKSHRIFLQSNCFESWATMVEVFPTSHELVFNMLRILSKLSAHRDCCEKLNQRKQCLKTLSSFFKFYRASIHIVIRVAYIFAYVFSLFSNMTSYLEDIRHQLYFDFNAWDDIYTCFQHYATSELKGVGQVDKMGISMAAWDYKAMKKQSDVEALMKITRLIANVMTVPEIGQHVYREHSQNYRDLVKQLKSLLATKANLDKHNELIACVLSCLTNILYYDCEALLASNEYKQVKKELIGVLVDFVAQIDNEEVCCESLRVISNLTRMKQFLKPVLDAKINEAVVILLDSTSKEIVYYSLGIIINLCADEGFKSENRSTLIEAILGILNECINEDLDMVTVSLKALSILIEGTTGSSDATQLSEIENCLVKLGRNCDQVMLVPQVDQSDLHSAQESRNLINLLLNSMPEQKFTCQVKNCGRKFADQAKLQEHVNRRHKLS